MIQINKTPKVHFSKKCSTTRLLHKVLKWEYTIGKKKIKDDGKGEGGERHAWNNGKGGRGGNERK